MSFLEKKGLVGKNLTQNIDGLEIKAGCSKEKMMFCHGNLNDAHCSLCKKAYSIEKLKEYIQKEEIWYCEDNACHGPIKPKIVLYGEDLPDEFYTFKDNLKDFDICIIMGTSLKVFPFSSIPYNLSQDCFKMVINLDKVGSFNYSNVSNNELFLEGKTDEILLKLLKDIELEKEYFEYKEQMENK